MLLCAVASAGALRGTSSADPSAKTTPFASLGARFGSEIRLGDVVSLRPFVDLAVPFTPTRLAIDGQTVWSTFPVVLSTGMAVVGHFR
jgi:hypothetical protein